MARQIVRRSFRRSSKRQTEWSLAFQSLGITAVPAASKVLLSVINPNAPSGIGTIVRSRGILSIRTDTPAANEHQTGAMGIAVVNSVAAALGVTGLPGPGTEIGFDWFVYQSFAQMQITSTTLTTVVGFQYEIDSKAMRKFGIDERLVFMIENLSTTNAFDMLANIRFLVKSG